MGGVYLWEVPLNEKCIDGKNPFTGGAPFWEVPPYGSPLWEVPFYEKCSLLGTDQSCLIMGLTTL